MSSKAYLAKFIKALSDAPEYLVLDTETTGFQNTGEVVQIAIINNRGDVLLDTLVKPSRPIPSDAAAVHGITNATVTNAPLWADVAPQVRDILTGKHLVIYNRQFDIQILFNSNRFNEVGTWDWNFIPAYILCAINAYAVHHGKWNNRRRSYTWQPLSTAAKSFKVPVKNAHSALGDCQMTLAVTQALLARYSGEVK